MKEKEWQSIIATDCGSTTTKAILIEKRGGEFRLAARGEAPTTVEAPFEDVTRGVLNALRELEEISGRSFLEEGRIIRPGSQGKGVDLYVSTSSAGGGLQMMVAGLVRKMTAESAERAALGAGAIVMDVISIDDGRDPHERIERIRDLRPDMILLSGGVDGGNFEQIVGLTETIRAARPRPRLGHSFLLPVIFAGNRAAREEVSRLLSGLTSLHVVENIRPVLERENLRPAREKIHDLFLEHVMAQAPGYRRLMEWADAPIMPTPSAMGLMVEALGEKMGSAVLAVDIGGATTDVFSLFGGVFNRTVSANLGMSYSISNVLAQAGMERLLRWLPFRIDEEDLRDRIGNKMIRPTTIPETLEDLAIEQALAREAMRLALEHHKGFAGGLKGIQKERTISDLFRQEEKESIVSMMDLSLIIGSGGVLSHAPRRSQAALMMVDAFLPEGFTDLAVDSIFMMPHLGVLSRVHKEAALEVFEKDCLLRLGSCIAPLGEGREGDDCVRVTITSEKGTQREVIPFGSLRLYRLAPGESVDLLVEPARGFDVGGGWGRAMKKKVEGGLVGIILDCRGRPFSFPSSEKERMNMIASWTREMDLYPEG